MNWLCIALHLYVCGRMKERGKDGQKVCVWGVGEGYGVVGVKIEFHTFFILPYVYQGKFKSIYPKRKLQGCKV